MDEPNLVLVRTVPEVPAKEREEQQKIEQLRAIMRMTIEAGEFEYL
jgi:hypothetical protein